MKKNLIHKAAMVAICWTTLFGFSACSNLRPDYAQKLKEENADLQKRWDALDPKMPNHAEAVRLYAYQCGYVAGLEDAAK